MTTSSWIDTRIVHAEDEKYLCDGKDFIDDAAIEHLLATCHTPDRARINDILQKSLAITSLTSEETAELLSVTDPVLLERMFAAAGEVKRKVYDNRIVTFAPLYTGNRCVNNCTYCGFRHENSAVKRRVLTIDEIKRETEILVGDIGHKRLIVVFGEHPTTDVDYIVDVVKAIYGISLTRRGHCVNIRRVNINAAPLSLEGFKRVGEAGIGTYQIFQETYHHETYARVHPPGTVKHDYVWRLYAHHRALEAGVDDVGLGALFGLYDWRFEVMGLVMHARELEARFGVGPHTISFPRLEPAINTPFIEHCGHAVTNDEFKRVVAILRLAVPYCGLIVTAREDAVMRRALIPLGCTQTDASTKIGIGAYSECADTQETERQQFVIGDARSLDEVVGDLARMGYITSFCTAGYRCGRTGEHIMETLRSGKEGMFCKLNAIITYREWLDDFASPETKRRGERIIERELMDARATYPAMYENLMSFYTRTSEGERDLYF